MAEEYTTTLRVRYSETDQMGTFYNSRALEWFEVARTETLREMGLPYAEMESRGALLPLVEAHVQYLGRAQYDDPLTLTTRVGLQGKARLRFDVDVRHAATADPVTRGWTVHAVTDPAGRPIRPPAWLTEMIPPSEP
ncbi:MAG: acyl-CoA thioesterase [Planctomycetota bacterium]